MASYLGLHLASVRIPDNRLTVVSRCYETFRIFRKMPGRDKPFVSRESKE